MYHSSSSENLAIPAEFRKTAENLFPSGWFSLEHGPDLAAVSSFAEALGIGSDYQRLLEIRQNAEQVREFLGHFQNNLDLLIQKTWVEKAEVSRKEKLQDKIPSLMELIIQNNFQQALKEFGIILEELAYLFFGSESNESDFTEYTFRFDVQLGLFWWYGSQLGSLKETGTVAATHDESLWAVLLLGLCYLTNF